MIDTPANQQRTKQIETVIRTLLTQGLTRGFYGSVGLEVVINDGTIQTIREQVDRLHK